METSSGELATKALDLEKREEMLKRQLQEKDTLVSDSERTNAEVN